MPKPLFLIGALAAWLLICNRRRSSSAAKPRIVSKGQPLASAGPDEISILSYNILADQYATPKKLHYTFPSHLVWSHRRQLISDEIAAVHADLVCLQEVDLARCGGGAIGLSKAHA
mmetsp:Transcript_34047/g.75500  ORF Transcript_34047/g.75500 Transcript_34047/m.75500 type:complete len:116 (-) Transcript_34047:325-672(-)